MQKGPSGQMKRNRLSVSSKLFTKFANEALNFPWSEWKKKLTATARRLSKLKWRESRELLIDLWLILSSQNSSNC